MLKDWASSAKYAFLWIWIYTTQQKTHASWALLFQETDRLQVKNFSFLEQFHKHVNTFQQLSIYQDLVYHGLIIIIILWNDILFATAWFTCC